MPQTTELLMPSWSALLGTLARAGGFAALAPMICTSPGVRHRVILAVLLSLILLPTTQIPSFEGASGELIATLSCELAIGLLFGFLLRALVASVSMGARLVDQQLGLSATAELEEDESASALSRLFQLLALALFFSLGGHRLVVAGLLGAPAVVDSTGLKAAAVLEAAAAILAQACWLTVQIAGPVVLSLLSANLAVGMIASFLPQFSVSTTAIPVQITFGLILLILSGAVIGSTLGREMLSALNWLRLVN